MINANLKKQKNEYVIKFNDKNNLDIIIESLEDDELTKLKVKKYIEYNSIILENANSFNFLSNEYSFDPSLKIDEMDLFDVKRRDLVNLNTFLKSYDNVNKVIKPKKNKKELKGAFTSIKRDEIHKPDVYDSYYKAFGIK